MDTPLNLYVKRARDILTLSSSLEHTGEYVSMITFLENTLTEVKACYKQYTSHTDMSSQGTDTVDAIISTRDVDVVDMDNIEDGAICYVTQLNQYCIKLHGLPCLRGNIGNIYNKDYSITKEHTTPCKHGSECSNLLASKPCKFYHDPYDVWLMWQYNIVPKHVYTYVVSTQRNYSSTAWCYDLTDIKPMHAHTSNVSVRKFGSRHTLEADVLKAMRRKSFDVEFDTFKAQLAHDILVYKYICTQASLNTHGHQRKR